MGGGAWVVRCLDKNLKKKGVINCFISYSVIVAEEVVSKYSPSWLC